MNNKKILKVIASFLSLMLLCGCTNEKKVQYFGDVGSIDENIVIESQSGPESKKNPTTVNLKYSDFENSPTISKKQITHSFFYDTELNSSLKIAYDEIMMGLTNYRDYISLSKNVSEAEFNHIMWIILTNEPSVFHVDYTYSYELDVGGNVRNFYPVYTIAEKEYSEFSEKNNSSLINFINGNVNSSEYDVLKKIYDQYKGKIDLTVAVPAYVEKTEKNSPYGYVSNSMISNKLSSLGSAKAISNYLSYVGIQNIVAAGEYTQNDDFEKCFTENTVNVSKDGLINTVSLNINNYLYWNIVKIGDSWINVDIFSDQWFSRNQEMPAYSFFAVPDEIIRQTRIFVPTYDLLGETPSCSTYNYSLNYRTMYFVKRGNETATINYIDTLIETISYSKKEESVIIQFETEANYNCFMTKFSERMVLFNETHDNMIPSYNLIGLNKTLTIEINDILYKKN